MVQVHDTHKKTFKLKTNNMSEVIESIYKDAYYTAINCGASESEAEEYAESYKENIADYLKVYYI